MVAPMPHAQTHCIYSYATDILDTTEYNSSEHRNHNQNKRENNKHHGASYLIEMFWKFKSVSCSSLSYCVYIHSCTMTHMNIFSFDHMARITTCCMPFALQPTLFHWFGHILIINKIVCREILFRTFFILITRST